MHAYALSRQMSRQSFTYSGRHADRPILDIHKCFYVHRHMHALGHTNELADMQP